MSKTGIELNRVCWEFYDDFRSDPSASVLFASKGIDFRWKYGGACFSTLKDNTEEEVLVGLRLEKVDDNWRTRSHLLYNEKEALPILKLFKIKPVEEVFNFKKTRKVVVFKLPLSSSRKMKMTLCGVVRCLCEPQQRNVWEKLVELYESGAINKNNHWTMYFYAGLYSDWDLHGPASTFAPFRFRHNDDIVELLNKNSDIHDICSCYGKN